jgi:transcription elongation factor Elf1
VTQSINKVCPGCGERLEEPVFDATTRVRDGKVTVDHTCGSCGRELTLQVEEDADWLPEDGEEGVGTEFRLVSKQGDRTQLRCPECGTKFNGAVFNASTEHRGGRLETEQECPECHEKLSLIIDKKLNWVPEQFRKEDEVKAEYLFVKGMQRVGTGVTAIFLTALLMSYIVGLGLPNQIPESVVAVAIALIGGASIIYVWYGFRKNLKKYFQQKVQ